MSRLFAGTSGFAYSQWKPAFYPAKFPAAKFLEHYAQRLNSVEINYTFRHLPAAKTLENWVTATPPGFVFALKGHMRITHIMRLKNAAEATDVFLRAIDPLRAARRLGPILFQLPPQMKCDLDVLAAFLEILPLDLRYAFEFRHASWFAEEIYQALRDHHATLCIAETEKLMTPEVRTASYIYFRFREPSYQPEELKKLAERIARCVADGLETYAFFKHEEDPRSPLNAVELLRSVRALSGMS